jgi:hypothetical protein
MEAVDVPAEIRIDDFLNTGQACCRFVNPLGEMILPQII